MNAESTFFRSSRPAVVVAPPGGDGVRAAALVLALPMRLAANPVGRRLLAAAALSVVLVTSVGFLYETADSPAAPASFRAAGGAVAAPAAARQASASPVRQAAPKAGPAEVAAAWFAARHGVAPDKVRALQQRRVSKTETRVLVMAEAGGTRMPSQYVTVRKGAGGWKVP
jgi:hypothetical protein